LQNCTTRGSVVEAGNGKPVGQAQVAIDGGQDIGAATDADGEFSIPAESCGKFEPQRLSHDNAQAILVRLQRISGVSGVVWMLTVNRSQTRLWMLDSRMLRWLFAPEWRR
jgi:hypothetical protein